jgi:hypothetical protein
VSTKPGAGHLDIGAPKQMAIFEGLFRDYSDDIPRSDLAMYVEDTVPNVTKDALARFESHAFFSPGRDVRARFESLKIYFVARWLANRLEAAVSGSPPEGRIVELLEKNASGNTDVFDFLLDRFATMQEPKIRAAISHALGMVRARSDWEAPSSALFHLAQRLSFRTEDSRAGRVAVILNLLGISNPIIKIAIHGQISGLDLSKITFTECVFNGLEFHNCNFGEETQFQKSRFEGDLKFEKLQKRRAC